MARPSSASFKYGFQSKWPGQAEPMLLRALRQRETAGARLRCCFTPDQCLMLLRHVCTPASGLVLHNPTLFRGVLWVNLTFGNDGARYSCARLQWTAQALRLVDEAVPPWPSPTSYEDFETRIWPTLHQTLLRTALYVPALLHALTTCEAEPPVIVTCACFSNHTLRVLFFFSGGDGVHQLRTLDYLRTPSQHRLSLRLSLDELAVLPPPCERVGRLERTGANEAPVLHLDGLSEPEVDALHVVRLVRQLVL